MLFIANNKPLYKTSSNEKIGLGVNSNSKQAHSYSEKTKITCGLLNCQSIANKIDQLSFYLNNSNTDLLFLTETWLNNQTLIFSDLSLNSKYSSILVNRESRRGGGVALIYNKALKIVKKFTGTVHGCEVIVAEINTYKLILLYRPPNLSISNSTKLFKFLNNHIEDNTILLGDFNLNNKDIEWFRSYQKPNSSIGLSFIDFLGKYGLKLINSEFTRNDQILDLCLSNSDDLSYTNTLPCSISSDHLLVSFSIICSKFKKSRIKPNKLYLFDPKSTKILNYFLSLSLNNNFYSVYNIHEKNTLLTKTISNFIECYIPHALTNYGQIRPKYPKALLGSIAQKRTLWRLMKQDRERYKPEYDSISLHIRIQIRNFYAKKENQYLSKDKLNIFKYMKNFINKKSLEIPTLVYNTNIITHDTNKAQIFAKLFSKHYTPITNDSNYSTSFNFNTNIPTLTDIDFDASTISEILRKLPNKNGTSPDGISYRYLKNCWFIISPYLSEIFRASMDSGSIPEIWKSSIVVPIFKKGERNNPENYRPISLTCAICRVIERIIVTKIYEFLTRNKLISENQFGFLRNRSTTLQLIKTINDFSDAMENKKNIDCIYLDFQKAFDSVPHDLLLFKLRLIGIGGKLIQWISNFITNRKFTVKINESYSDDYHVTSGVPQGSVLGPVLFLIYINDLPDIIPVGISIKLFADDVKLYVTHKSNQERKQLELALINISQWCKEWKIKIAPTKSFVLHLGNNNPKHQYKLDQNIITEVQSIRDLGILIDNKLKFTEHISNIIKSAYYRMRLLFKYLKTRSIKIWKSVYTSYIRSLLEYSTVNWSPNSKKDINRLEKCQKFYTKIALKKCRLPYIRYQNRLTLFELPTLENRRKILDLVTIYKIINGYTCLDPKSLFNFSERSSSRFFKRIIHKHKLAKTSHLFIARASKLWNQLDKDIATSPTVSIFKNKLIKAIN